MATPPSSTTARRLRRAFARAARKVKASTKNALELARLGRLGQPYGAPYQVVDEGPHHRLRKYAAHGGADAPVVLLVPPLMVTSEVYDIEADNSAVAALGAWGVSAYVVDFGAPEREAGGMKRTLDDHVLAVVRCIERIRQATGRAVHLAGYSQGGMFAYQAAAFVRGDGIRTVITFGAPVDIHKSLPAIHSDATAALISFAEPLVKKLIERIEGLPGELTSTGFKLVSTRKEIEQRIDFVRKLHDRGALVRREARRRFLGGEGFVAWPGPAFREFVEQFIVHNRMLSGGFVVSGRAATLADITVPILAFIGSHDDMARPAAVRAIDRAAPDAKVSFAVVDAGHFGIVVGSRATKVTWPTVADWILHHEGRGPLPALLRDKPRPAPDEDDEPEGAGFDVDVDIDLFVDTLSDAVRDGWRSIGDLTSSASDAFDGVRYQEPRLRRLANLTPDTRTSMGRALAERAASDPDATFFLWRGRAFTYRDADVRVSNVVRGLHACGVRPGAHVGVVMGSRPSFLSVVTALGRLGAVPVLVPPDGGDAAIGSALAELGVQRVATDPSYASKVRGLFKGEVLVLGGGGGARSLAPGVIDLEAIDPERAELPRDLPLDAGRARDLALILLRPTEAGQLRAAAVTNHRFALSALGSAAACTLKPDDTVYCGIPLHHPAGILVSVAAALVGGARLALSDGFAVERFFPEVRRYGATVVFYAGEMLRPLVHTAPTRGDRNHPVRLFAGSGMRPDLWQKLRERFGVGVMEFYASTTERVIMANASGEKVGALGRRLPGSAEVAVARVDLRQRELLRNDKGRLIRTTMGEPGLLIARLDAGASPGATTAVDAFEPGDRWYVSGDVVRADADGELWFVDAISGFVATSAGMVSTRAIEDALYTLPEIELAAAFAAEGGALEAAVVARSALLTRDRLVGAFAGSEPHARPIVVAVVDALPLTEGYRPNKTEARKRAAASTQRYRLD